jgi:hypothetical protein
MTRHPHHEFSIPEETARVARAAYPKGNISMKMRDAMGTISYEESFAQLFPQNGRPVEAPWRLAFITVVQFIEVPGVHLSRQSHPPPGRSQGHRGWPAAPIRSDSVLDSTIEPD